MDELKWYLYDLIRETLEKHGIDESAYSLETKRSGAVCLTPGETGFVVSGGGKEALEQEDLYRSCRELFLRIFPDEESTETAMQEFLTRTLDLPAMMKQPSVFGLETRIYACRNEMETLEQKVSGPDGTKWKAKLKLDRIYIEGLLKNLKETDRKRYEKIRAMINEHGDV